MNERESATAQIDRLAAFIAENVPGEPSQSQGAVDTAIRLLESALMREAKADAWSEGAAAVIDIRISGDRYASVVRNPLPENPYRKASQ